MIVISNSSPLIALARVRRLDLLKHLFGRVIIPPVVYEEVAPQGKYGDQYEVIHAAVTDFIDVIAPTMDYAFTRMLQEGERGVLNLTLDMKADILIMDDRKARNEAKELGISAMLALTSDILKQAENEGMIPSYPDLMEELKSKNIFLPL